MQRSDWFALLLAVLSLGAGAYLNTFPAEIIRGIGLILMAAAIIGLVIWFSVERGGRQVNTWGPFIFIIGGPIAGALWLFLASPAFFGNNQTDVGERSVPQKQAQLVSDVRFSLINSGDSQRVVTFIGNSAVSGPLRIFIEYSFQSGDERWSPKIKLLLADIPNAYRGQQLSTVIVTHTGPGVGDFRWGSGPQHGNNSTFDPRTEYRTSLVFEGNNSAEQYYKFKIVKIPRLDQSWSPAIVSQDDLAAQ